LNWRVDRWLKNDKRIRFSPWPQCSSAPGILRASNSALVAYTSSVCNSSAVPSHSFTPLTFYFCS
jgi:hypothetical protein